MSSADFVTPECGTNRAPLLAETVAEGLHSLAQPLTTAQWYLELAMGVAGTERKGDNLAEALVALEYVASHLDFLRDIIRPFRKTTECRPESLRNALSSASEMQQEILKHEGIQVIFCEGCAEGTVTVPVGFVQHIASRLFTFLRSLAPLSVKFDVSESRQSVLLLATLAYSTKPEKDVKTAPGYSVIRSYVEVLAGGFSIAPDFSSIRLVIPKII